MVSVGVDLGECWNQWLIWTFWTRCRRLIELWRLRGKGACVVEAPGVVGSGSEVADWLR